MSYFVATYYKQLTIFKVKNAAKYQAALTYAIKT